MSVLSMSIARAASSQVHDQVADELAGCVTGDVATSANPMDFDTAPCQLLLVNQQILCVARAAQRDHGRVFEKQQAVACGAVATGFDCSLLERQRVQVRNPTQPLHGEARHARC